METEKELNTKILKVTMTILENYPELSEYLGEMPVTIPNAENPEINRKVLRAYYDSLVSLMESYAREHAKCDITEMNDIRQMVDSFYDKARVDDLLGEIFQGAIQGAWSEHLEKMYRFWQTVLLEKHTYFGSPFPPHAKLPVGKAHFERWLKLFNENIDEQFAGKTAEEAKWRAAKMAEMFQSKIEYLKNNPLNILS